jgi:hypothetical protein
MEGELRVAHLDLKTGRDYSDFKLEAQLRTSLRYLRDTFLTLPRPD